MAMLKLDKSPIMNDNVQAACLPEAGHIPAHDEQCYISGWGNLYSKTFYKILNDNNNNFFFIPLVFYPVITEMC